MSHKTVFVMDHGPAFSLPCDQMEFDFHKSRAMGAGGYIPSAPVTKTMWTTATEAVFEYCRIVWDLAPEDRLVRFVVAGGGAGADSGGNAGNANSWEDSEQNSQTVSAGFARFGRPPPREDPASAKRDSTGDVMGGLALALENLCQATPTQRRKLKEKGSGAVVNRGRVICITHVLDDGKVDIF